jgi:hypothetical protein
MEDAELLGRLFPIHCPKEDIPRRLRLYCASRQDRALAVRSKSVIAGKIYEMVDGPLQEKRDYMFRNNMAMALPMLGGSPKLMDWLYGHDVEAYCGRKVKAEGMGCLASL